MGKVPDKYVGLELSDEYVEYLENQLKSITGIVILAERWCGDHTMEESKICMSALKDIRRITQQEV